MHIQRGKVATRIGSYGCVKCSSESSHSFKIVTACGNSTMVAVQKSASYTYSCAAMKYILVTTERQLQRRTISKYFGTHSRRKLAARPPLHFPTILAIFIVVVLEAIVVSVQLFAAGEKEYGRVTPQGRGASLTIHFRRWRQRAHSPRRRLLGIRARRASHKSRTWHLQSAPQRFVFVLCSKRLSGSDAFCVSQCTQKR